MYHRTTLLESVSQVTSEAVTPSSHTYPRRSQHQRIELTFQTVILELTFHNHHQVLFGDYFQNKVNCPEWIVLILFLWYCKQQHRCVAAHSMIQITLCHQFISIIYHFPKWFDISKLIRWLYHAFLQDNY